MKVKVIVEFDYGEIMSKEIEELAKEKNKPIEDIVKFGIENMFNECYMCEDGETFSVSAELIED